MKILYGAILILVLSSCGNMKKHENPLIIDFNDRFDFGRLKAGDISKATDYVLSQADNIRDEIIAIDDKQRSFENTLLRIDDLHAVIESVWSPGYLMGSVHTDGKIRDEGIASSKKIQNYITELSLNEDLYHSVLSYSKSKGAKKLTGYKKKFLNDVMLDYKRSGFSLSTEEREKVKIVLDKLTELGLQFDKNIRSSQDTLF